MTAPYDMPLGATCLDDRSCRFLVWAPRAMKIEVHILSPRDCIVPMEPLCHGYFAAHMDNLNPGALYKYRIDGDRERPDPASRFQPGGVHGPSQAVDHRFTWEDSAWCGILLRKYVLYEIHVGTFTPEGTFDAIIPRLTELKNLGVTAIEIMPVAQFPGDRNWGYDGVFPYAVQNSYGGPAGLKRLVNACHSQGLAAVLDVVYNHLGPEGNYSGDFGPYFTDHYHTPWGNALNLDGRGSDAVRRFFIDNALQWIDEFHFDALRIDAVHAIVDPTARHFLEELAAAVHNRAAGLGRRVYLIAESDRNDPRAIRPPEVNGWGLDATWNDDLHHAVHVLLTGESGGYYADFSGLDDLARAYRDAFVYTGQYSRFRQRRHGAPGKDIPAERFVVFVQNHDQVGNRKLGERLSALVSFEQLKFAAGAVLLSPFIPLLFMGEEYGETAPFQYFVSHGDPDLIEAVRKGRAQDFVEFGWAGDTPDPQSAETFLRSRLNWDLRKQGKHPILLAFYQELLRLRREIPALSILDKDALQAVPLAGENILLVTRGIVPNRAFLVFHFGEKLQRVSIPIPSGHWEKALDSAEPKWDGEGGEPSRSILSKGDAHLSLSPWSLLLFFEKPHTSPK